MSKRAIGRAALDAAPFPRATCDTLFAAVLIDDEVDEGLRLPDAVRLDYGEDELLACFRLCRQMWIEGFDAAALRRFAGTLMHVRDLPPAERLAFKHIRARFKHVRYAHALYGATHRYPAMLDRVTITMGQAQDAWRNARRGAVLRRAVQLRLLLSRPGERLLRAEGDRLRPATPASFRALLERDVALLDALVAQPSVTGHAFHAARKVVGRQVSFWDTLRTLAPDEDRIRMSRWLAAINGRMGALHDAMVERRGEDRASYATAFALPPDIRDPIAALTARVRAAAGSCR